MRISLHYNELSSINASDKWALSGEPYLRSPYAKSLMRKGSFSRWGSKKGHQGTKQSLALSVLNRFLDK